MGACAKRPKPPVSNSVRRRYWIASDLGWAFGWVFLGLLAALTVWRMQPPAVTPANADPTLFSAARARVHLEQIAREPHPAGSPAARAVHDYLVGAATRLGLDVEQQHAPGCTLVAGFRQCAVVDNVVATLHGRDSRSAVLLSAHYDSAAGSPAAADDGAGVAALLETARALRAGPRPEHDVIFAFVDAEEELLLGAAALSKTGLGRVRVLANFEARGNRGASALIAAPGDGATLVEEFAASTPRPVVNSFYCALARILPNGTDAEIYERAGVKTLSFAFADGVEAYHQGTDTLANLDLRSLQHHGLHALAFARHFANSDLRAISEARGDGVYFDLFARFVVHYPLWIARALAVWVVGAVAVLVWRAQRNDEASVRAILACAGLFAVATCGLAALGVGIEWLTTRGFSRWAALAERGPLLLCLSAFALAGLVWLQGVGTRRAGPRATALGPLAVWALATGAVAFGAPSASHVLTWPLAGATAAHFVAKERVGLQVTGLLPAVVLLSQVVYSALVVLGAASLLAPLLAVIFGLGLCAPALEPLARRGRNIAPTLSVVAALGALTLAVRGRLAAAPPTGDSLIYAVDALKHSAEFLSTDGEVDAYTAQFLGANPARRRESAFPSALPLLVKATEPRELAGPELELLSERIESGQREILLRVRSARGARQVFLWETGSAKISEFWFDGVAATPIIRFSAELDEKLVRTLIGAGYTSAFAVSMTAIPEAGSLLTLRTPELGPLEFRALDRSDGLAFRPADIAPREPRFTTTPPAEQTWVSSAPLRIAARAKLP